MCCQFPKRSWLSSSLLSYNIGARQSFLVVQKEDRRAFRASRENDTIMNVNPQTKGPCVVVDELYFCVVSNQNAEMCNF